MGNQQKIRQANNARFIAFLFLIAVFLVLGRIFSFDIESFRAFMAQFPPAVAWPLYILIYVVVTFLIWIGPKDIFRVVAAVAWGPYISTLLVYICEMISLAVFFTLSRHLGRDYVVAKISDKWEKVDKVLDDKSVWGMFWVRFFPIIPFRWLDLGFGLTKVPLKRYLLAAMLSSPLRIFFVQFYWSLGADIATNPHLMQEYLLEHPAIMYMSFAYVLGAIGMAFIIKKKSERK